MNLIAVFQQTATEVPTDEAATSSYENFQFSGPMTEEVSSFFAIDLRRFRQVDQLAIHGHAVVVEADDLLRKSRQIGTALKVA